MSVPPGMPIQPLKGTGSGLTNQAGQNVEIYLQENSPGRDLMSVLKPGDVLHGRVVEQFNNGAYLFTIRGRNLIASSNTPLMRDSVYPFEVLQTKNGIHIRLVNNAAIDQASTSNLDARLQRLHLPVTAQSQMVLQHFEQAGAPLNTDRLQQALHAVQNAAPAQQQLIAASHALLAKHNVPATPALLQLAQTAITQQGTSTQQALPQLQQLLPQLQAQLQNQTQNQAQNQAQNQQNNASTASTAPTSGNNNAATNPGSAPGMLGTVPTAAPTPNTAQASQVINQQLNLNTAAITTHNQFTTLQTQGLSLENAQNVMQALQSSGIHPDNTQTTITTQTGEQATVNPNAVDQQIAATIADQAPLKSMVQELAQLSQLMQHHHVGGDQQESVQHIMRELSADTILKPQHLNDYDSVLPLVLQHQGQAQQARLAIAKRSIPGQQMEATFLRVDLELQRLGPLSLRMSSGHGPIVITIFGTGKTISTLEQGLPALQEDLKTNNIEAHIRIGNLLEHQESLHG